MKAPKKDRIEAAKERAHARVGPRRGKRIRGGKHPGYLRNRSAADLAREIDSLEEIWSTRRDPGAFYDALMLSAIRADRPFHGGERSTRDSLPLPRWVLDEVLTRVRAELRTISWDGGPKRGGRTARWIERYKQDRIDERRHSEVEPLVTEDRLTLEEAFETVTLELEGTFAAGSTDAIRHSWQKVKRRRGASATYEAYFVKIPLGPTEID